MPRDWMPMTHFDTATNIATARGYTGQGVSTGRVLAELISDKRTVLSQLPIAQRSSPYWSTNPCAGSQPNTRRTLFFVLTMPARAGKQSRWTRVLRSSSGGTKRSAVQTFAHASVALGHLLKDEWEVAI
jgi:hypothetical protein